MGGVKLYSWMYWIEVSGQLLVPASLPSGKNPCVT
jgi:hypothetical protein